MRFKRAPPRRLFYEEVSLAQKKHIGKTKFAFCRFTIDN